jgi:hypothetical protein
MSNNLTKKDYIKILNYYKLPIPKSYRLIKLAGEKIMANKLCKCIKKLDPVNEARSIGICTKTLFNNRGFKRSNFSCKKKRYVTFRKTKKNR